MAAGTVKRRWPPVPGPEGGFPSGHYPGRGPPGAPLEGPCRCVGAAAVRASAARTAHGVHVIPAPRLGSPGFRVKSCCVAWVSRARFRHQPPWLGSTLLEIRRCLDVEVENCPSNRAKVLGRNAEPDVLLLAVVAFVGPARDMRGEHAPCRTDTRLALRPGRSERRSCGLGPALRLSLRCRSHREERPRRPERVRRRRARTKPRRRPGRVRCQRSTRAAPTPVGRDAGPV